MRILLPTLVLLSTPALAETARSLDAHEHGVGALNIAVDGTTVAMELRAPGADIVGFEYEARSAEDRAAIAAAVATLAKPLELFALPVAAECSVTQASAALESEGAEHEEHGGHDGHGHDDDHGHAQTGASHTEFHAEYLLSCSTPSALSRIEFAYFDAFENARELEVQVVTASGAQAFEVLRDQPILDLRGMF